MRKADRVVFEVVTPTKGRRLYQATSETEMKVRLRPKRVFLPTLV
jgi:hypothetical protein